LKFNLFHKIFSAFMITILAAIVVMSLIMYFSANWRFSEYVIKVEMGALDDLVAALGSLHQEKKSWAQFREDPGVWFRFIWLYLPEIPGYHSPPPPPGPRLAEGHEERGLSSGDPAARPQERPYNGYFHEFEGKGTLRTGPPGPPPPPPRRESIGPRVALFDENKQLVVGPPGFPVRGYVFRPINSGGQTVGWLGLMPLRHGSHPLELAFIQEQTRAIWLAGFCVFTLAGVISFFLSSIYFFPSRS